MSSEDGQPRKSPRVKLSLYEDVEGLMGPGHTTWINGSRGEKVAHFRKMGLGGTFGASWMASLSLGMYFIKFREYLRLVGLLEKNLYVNLLFNYLVLRF